MPFSIYSSIYPTLTRICFNMFAIQEAASKYGGTMWRAVPPVSVWKYHEMVGYQPWSMVALLLCPHDLSTAKPGTPCIDFNKGFCKFPHICSICFTAQHDNWSCQARNTNSDTFRSFRPQPFRGSGELRGSHHRPEVTITEHSEVKNTDVSIMQLAVTC